MTTGTDLKEFFDIINCTEKRDYQVIGSFIQSNIINAAVIVPSKRVIVLTDNPRFITFSLPPEIIPIDETEDVIDRDFIVIHFSEVETSVDTTQE